MIFSRRLIWNVKFSTVSCGALSPAFFLARHALGRRRGGDQHTNQRRREVGVPVLRFQLNLLIFRRSVGIADDCRTHAFLSEVRGQVQFNQSEGEEQDPTLLASTRDMAESLSTIEKWYSTSSFFPIVTQSM